ncbi:MAG: hypothetical protein WAU02_01285 [Candidatus Saccharimonadales bacterium]
MHTTITLKQFRTDMPRVIEEIAKGRSFTVIKRSQPVFEITPAKEEVWDLDFTEIASDGVPIEQVLTALQTLREQEDGRQTTKVSE